jgi:hypothetical protein
MTGSGWQVLEGWDLSIPTPSREDQFWKVLEGSLEGTIHCYQQLSRGALEGSGRLEGTFQSVVLKVAKQAK